MILRLSDKISKRIGVRPIESLPMSANPFADWSTHLFSAGRLDYILASNTTTLYSVIFPAQTIKREAAFRSYLLAQLRAALIDDGFEFHYKRLIDVESDTVSYSKPFNRGLIASLNDLAELSSYNLEVEEKSSEDTMRSINDTALSAINQTSPREAFQRLSFRG